MTIPVVWATWADGNARCCWDQQIVEDLLTGRPVPAGVDFEHLDHSALAELDGAVVVIPARYNADRIDQINADLAHLAWVVIVLTSDEESTFLWRQLDHPDMRIWVQAPRPDKHNDNRLRFIPHGWQPGTPQHLATLDQPSRPVAWYFAGQVNHGRRDDCLASMARVWGGIGEATPGFTQGRGRAAYLEGLAAAKIAPSPSGPASADSFRTWEALEAGAVPIVDQGPAPDIEGRAITGYPPGFWDLVCGGTPPFPVVDDWVDAPDRAAAILDRWPASANQVQAWWLQHRRNLACRFADDITALARPVPRRTIADRVTVVIPTSPIASHPSTEIIDATVASIRSHPDLADAELIVMIDGIRPEQEDRRADYEEYTRRLLWQAAHHWGPCLPLLFDRHHHQAAMTREALTCVRTPLIMFVEHDTPLLGGIDWPGLANTIERGHLDLVRLYHEAQIPPGHHELMLGQDDIDGVPVLRTSQWSQRPHLTRTAWYAGELAAHFQPDDRWMIEDRMHSVVAVTHDRLGPDAAWDKYRLGIYTPGPEGAWKRSEHLDGRAGDPKWVDR